MFIVDFNQSWNSKIVKLLPTCRHCIIWILECVCKYQLFSFPANFPQFFRTCWVGFPKGSFYKISTFFPYWIIRQNRNWDNYTIFFVLKYLHWPPIFILMQWQNFLFLRSWVVSNFFSFLSQYKLCFKHIKDKTVICNFYSFNCQFCIPYVSFQQMLLMFY